MAGRRSALLTPTAPERASQVFPFIDTPYREIVAASRAVSQNLYRFRLE